MPLLEVKEALFAGEKGSPIALDTKLLTETGEFEGYASTFGNVDRGGEVCVAGCFSTSLQRRTARQVKMLFQHNTHEPIGVWTDMHEDSKGLAVRGKLLTSLNKGREVYEMMKAGALDGLSIGFQTIRDEVDRASGTRRIVEADLREVSVVTFPMNEEATITLVKGNDIASPKEWEDHLVFRCGLSRQKAKAFMAAGYKAIRPERDAGRDGDDNRHAERDAGTGDEGLLEAIRGLRSTIAAA